MRILLVEDEVKIAQAIKQGLEQQHYAVDIVHTADDGYAFASSESYDVMIIDRMLPEAKDGLEIVKKLRLENNPTPILLLTAKDRIVDRTEGLNSGADDYLVKPFAFVELLARVRALLRRPATGTQNALTYADVNIDADGKEVYRAGNRIHLSAKEYSLLIYFLHHPNRTISKEELLAHIWDYESEVLPNTVEVHIASLRKKLEAPGSPALIHTRRGFGYVFGDSSQ